METHTINDTPLYVQKEVPLDSLLLKEVPLDSLLLNAKSGTYTSAMRESASMTEKEERHMKSHRSRFEVPSLCHSAF